MTSKSKGTGPFKGNKQSPGIVRASAPDDKSIAPALGDRFCGFAFFFPTPDDRFCGFVFYFPIMTSKSFLSPGEATALLRLAWAPTRTWTRARMSWPLGEFIMDSAGDLAPASKSNQIIHSVVHWQRCSYQSGAQASQQEFHYRWQLLLCSSHRRGVTRKGGIDWNNMDIQFHSQHSLVALIIKDPEEKEADTTSRRPRLPPHSEA
jgi:hypothetical protein